MTDPVTTGITTAVAAAATAVLTDGSRALAARVAAFLRERFQRDPSSQATVEAATRSPRDDDAVQRLAELLNQRMRDDPAFTQRLRALLIGTATADGQHHDELTNTVTGLVHGSVVQARDIHGGIAFNAPSEPRSPRD